jgi:hypothetical protein
MTHGLRQSDNSDLSQGFHHGKSRALVNRNPDSVIPDFLKWEISRCVASINRMTQIYLGVFTMENPELLSRGISIPRFLISRNGRSHDAWPPSIGRLRYIPGFFAPIHWGLNPRVTPDRSNDCWVFPPRSDSSDRFPTCGLCHDFLDVENQRSGCSHGPWGSTIPISSLPTKTQRNQVVRHLTPYFLLPNLTVMSDHRLPDGISSIDQYLSRLRYSTLHLLLSI